MHKDSPSRQPLHVKPGPATPPAPAGRLASPRHSIWRTVPHRIAPIRTDRTDPTRPDPTRPDPSRPDPTRLDRAEPNRTDPSRPILIRPDQTPADRREKLLSGGAPAPPIPPGSCWERASFECLQTGRGVLFNTYTRMCVYTRIYGSGRVGSGPVGSDRVGPVKSGPVRSGRSGSGRVGSGRIDPVGPDRCDSVRNGAPSAMP